MKLVSKEDRLPLENQLKKTKRIFTLCTIVFIVVAVTNLYLSHYEYFWNMMLNILLTVAYGSYVVYYLTALLPYRKAKCKFFTDWDNGIVSDEFVEVVDQNLTYITKNGLHYYEVNAVVTIKEKRVPRQLLLFDNNPLPTGKLFVKTFGNVVLEYKVHHEN